MKFSSIVAGQQKTEQVEIKLHGKECKPLVRALSLAEEMDVDAYAIGVAKAKGAKPEKGETIFDAATMAKALEIAYLDEDSPADARERFFDNGPEAVTTLDKDTIALLYERQELIQEECSPGFRIHSAVELFDMLRGAASKEGQADPLYFLRFAPSTRLTLWRFTVALLADSPVLKSTSTSPSSEKPTST
jgi:hypothetical protein